MYTREIAMKGHSYTSHPVDEDGYVNWNEQENAVRRKLVATQSGVVVGRACDEFMEGLEILNFPKDRVIQLPEVNKILGK